MKMNWINTLIELSDKLPTGKNDPNCLSKLLSELIELVHALQYDDTIACALEVSDVLYYTSKARHNGFIIEDQAFTILKWMSELTEIDDSKLVHCAITKYQLRACNGNPKDFQREREAIEHILFGGQND